MSSSTSPSPQEQPTVTTTSTITADNDIKEQEQEQKQEIDDIDYSRKVNTIATKGIYEFEFVEGDKAGEKIRVERQKISNRMMLELERDRAEYGALINRFTVDGRADNNKPLTKEDRIQAAEMLGALYIKLAKYYFHISKEDFELMDWDSSKPNLDAAANVSIRGRPNLV